VTVGKKRKVKKLLRNVTPRKRRVAASGYRLQAYQRVARAILILMGSVKEIKEQFRSIVECAGDQGDPFKIETNLPSACKGGREIRTALSTSEIIVPLECCKGFSREKPLDGEMEDMKNFSAGKSAAKRGGRSAVELGQPPKGKEAA